METDSDISEDLEKPKVIVADDDRDHCLALRLALEKIKCQVEVVHNGQELLGKLPAFNPKLLLLDSMLPDLPGIKCLKKIKSDACLQHIAVIMCSGNANFDYTLECLEAGASAFVHKPCDLGRLAERVGHLISEN